ncbi:hypothetical protein OG542_39910 [Streptomyces violaceus]
MSLKGDDAVPYLDRDGALVEVEDAPQDVLLDLAADLGVGAD